MRTFLTRHLLILPLVALAIGLHAGEALEAKPDGEAFAKFQPVKAPVYTTVLLKQDDRLAIIGDSITEQKQYSRIIETYLTVCLSEPSASLSRIAMNA